MKESDIVKAISRYLKFVRGFAWKEHGGMYGTAGIPKKFEQISVDMGYSIQHTFRLHDKALKELAKIYEVESPLDRKRLIFEQILRIIKVKESGRHSAGVADT
jgi:hypothetical protein